MKNTTTNHFATLALAALTTIAFAQNAPYAPGPQHPMAAPLSPNSPYAKVDPRLNNIPPVQPMGLNKPVLLNETASYDPFTKVTEIGPVSEGGRLENMLMPGHSGSVDTLDQAKSGDKASIQTIFGPDNRTVLLNATGYPYRTNAELIITFRDGAMEQGSCTIVNAKYALTAGHCVYSSAHGGWATKIEVMPGRCGAYLPYGSAYVTYMRTYTGWTNSGNYQYDLALITLDRNIGLTTGWLGYGWWSNLSGVVGTLSAYDADRAVNYQKFRNGVITPESLTVSYMMDTYPGCSGGGVYRSIAGSNYVMAVNNWQFPYKNSAVRITSSRFSDISGWIASGH